MIDIILKTLLILGMAAFSASVAVCVGIFAYTVFSLAPVLWVSLFGLITLLLCVGVLAFDM